MCGLDRVFREVTDNARIDAVIKNCDCLRLGFVTKEGAYILPVNFGFEHAGGVRHFYLHGANEGKKAALLRQGGSVALSSTCGPRLKPGARGVRLLLPLLFGHGPRRGNSAEQPGRKSPGAELHFAELHSKRRLAVFRRPRLRRPWPSC